MDSSLRVSVPFLDRLVPGGVKPATIFTVEYDPESQWLAVATTITARFLQANGHVAYTAQTRSPEEVKNALAALGVDIPAAQKAGLLRVSDQYSATLSGGRLESSSVHSGVLEEIQGGVRFRSLKVGDLSVQWLKFSKLDSDTYEKTRTWGPAGSLGVVESISEMLRFNEENAFAEWMVSRVNPIERRAKRITLQAYVRGIHGEAFSGAFLAAGFAARGLAFFSATGIFCSINIGGAGSMISSPLVSITGVSN